MQKVSSRKLTAKMLIAMAAAIVCGAGVIALRENLTASGNAAAWNTHQQSALCGHLCRR